MEIKRGKLLTYDSATGKGLITLLEDASSPRLSFEIEHWKSSDVPKVGMIMDLHTSEGKTTFAPISDSELVKEKLGNFGLQLTQTFDKAVGSDGAAQAKAMGAGAVAAIGMPVLAAYAMFLIGTVFFNFANIKSNFSGSVGASLYDLSDLLSKAGNGGGSKFFIWIGFLSVLVPLFWKNAKAWFAYCLPLFAVLVNLYSIWSIVSDMKKQMGQLYSAMGSSLPGISDYFSLGLGFYLTMLAAVVLTFIGLMNFLKQK